MAVALDIGINQIEQGGVTRIVGEVDIMAVRAVAGWITPVAVEVGLVTVVILMQNEIIAHQRQVAARWI